MAVCGVALASCALPDAASRRGLLQQGGEAYCKCKDGLDPAPACPNEFAKAFEKSGDIRGDIQAEGKRATWALECTGFNYSDGVTESVCTDECKLELEKVYGPQGHCACVNDLAMKEISKQSFTLLNMNPNDILNACFGACEFSLPKPKPKP